jgi:Fic family protein
MNKLTYVTALENVLTNDNLDADVREKLEALKATLIKRNAKTGTRKPTKTQRENAEIKAQFVTFLAGKGEPVKAGDVAAQFGFNVQKAAALLNQLVKEGTVTKAVGEKRAVVFTVA